MNNETLQRWALIAEIVGGIAILVSLVFLAVEVRSNTQTLRAAAYDSIVADLANARLENARDNEVWEVESIRNTRGVQLNSEQDQLSEEVALATFQHFERAFIQWEAGVLGDEEWIRFERLICNATGQPDFEENIGRRLDIFTTDRFTEYRKSNCPSE